jgi:hypothetical protein
MRKKIWETTNLGAAFLAAAILLVGINWIGFRHYKRWDLTKTHVYSLSEQSLKVLKALPKDITIYVLFDNQDVMYDNLKELLHRYEAASPRLRVKVIDPEKSMLEAKKLVEELGITQNNSIVFACGAKKKFVYSSDLAEYDYSGMQFGQQPTLKAFKGEEAITSALLNVSEDHQAKVGFLQGHGEKSSSDMAPAGLNQAVDQLRKDNYVVEDVSLLGKTEVPKEFTVLAVMGPRTPPLPPELDALKKFVDGGGALLMGLDPEFDMKADAVKPTGFEDFLKGYGLIPDADLAIDRGKTLPFFGPEVLYVDSFRAHAITDTMQRVPVLLPIARSVTTATAPEGWKVQVLMETSGEGWGETDITTLLEKKTAEADARDKKGPVPVAAVSEGKGKVLLIGDSDFATNTQIQNLGNETFFSNSIHYLAQREKLIAIAPKPVEHVSLTLNGGQMRTIFIVVVLLMPALAAAAGIFVWKLRRA